MRVLVVEDDKALGSFLQKGLALEGHNVEWVGNGDAAIASVLSEPPDLMVLDLTLPDRDGTEVLEALAAHIAGTAVLVLTGRSQVEERVHCLNLGADDYLLKPFSFHELAARCRAILRRRERVVESSLSYAGVDMNLLTREVRYGDSPIELTIREFNLLQSLLRRRGECCSRAELLNEVWRSAPEAGTNIVDVYITYLRRKLTAVATTGPFAHSGESIIETVRGSGYRIRSQRMPAQPAARSASGTAISHTLPLAVASSHAPYERESLSLAHGA